MVAYGKQSDANLMLVKLNWA